MSFEFFIGSRYLRARKSHTFISLITIFSTAGVAIGVMALIVVIAVMSGFESDLKSRILGVESHIVLMRHGGAFSEYRNALEIVENIDGVRAATPFIVTQVMLRSASGISGAVLRGIDPESAHRVIINFDKADLQNMSRISQTNPDKAKLDKNENFADPGIIIGSELAKKLNIIKGDRIYLLSPHGMISPIGHLPAMKRFQVIGFFESGMYEYDNSLAFIHIKDAQKILRWPDSVTGIEIKTNNIYDAKKISDQIISTLGSEYWTRDWTQMNHNLFSALKLEKTVMFIILTLIILVAAFNIASSLIMMVMEKTRDIAILKAMGATSKNIGKIFVFQGMLIGLVGTALGVCSGFILCAILKRYKFIELPKDVYYITTLPVQLEGLDVCLIAFAAIIICFLATLYPARQASKLNPVEAIRYG